MGLFNLIFTLGLNKSGFDAGLRGVHKTTSRFADEIHSKFAGLFTIGAVTAWGTHVAKAALRIKDLSEQTRISTDDVQKLDYGLEQSGMQFEDLTMALNKLSLARREAVENNGDTRAAFKALGMSVDDVNDSSKQNVDILMKMADALKRGTMTAKDQAIAMDILGAKSGKLANVLAELSTFKPQKLIEESDIQAIDRADKSMKRLLQTAQAFTAGPLGNLADVLTGALNFAGESIGPNRKAPNRKGIMQHIADVAMKPQVDALAKGIGDAFKDMLNAGMGVQPPGAKPLFQVDKNVTAKAPYFPAPPRDSLVSVGNFLGGDTSSIVRTQIKTITDDLRQIKQNTKKLADGSLVIRK